MGRYLTCPKCGHSMVNYDGHIIDQYCSNCSFQVNQDGTEEYDED